MLGCAIIKTAIEDYVYGDITEGCFKQFLYNTLWIKCLDLDIDFVFEKAKEKHDEREELKAKRLMEYCRSQGLD